MNIFSLLPAIASSIAVLISIGSLIFAIISFRKSHKIEKRQLEIEEAREVDKKKANLTARITEKELKRSGTSRIIYKYLLLIENKGNAEARNIALLLNNTPVLKHPIIHEGKEEIKQIGRQSSFKYELASGFMGKLPIDLEMTWEDDSDEIGKYNTTLTL